MCRPPAEHDQVQLAGDQHHSLTPQGADPQLLLGASVPGPNAACPALHNDGVYCDCFLSGLAKASCCTRTQLCAKCCVHTLIFINRHSLALVVVR